MISYFHMRAFNIRTENRNKVDTKGNYHTVLGLLLVIGQQSRLKNKISHVNKWSPYLPTPIPHHPSFIHHLRTWHLQIFYNFLKIQSTTWPLLPALRRMLFQLLKASPEIQKRQSTKYSGSSIDILLLPGIQQNLGRFNWISHHWIK